MATNGTEGRDTIHGWGWDDEINGLGGSDDLFGEGGNDLLRGGEGSDLLKGGEGDDRLFGGADNDVLVSGERDPFFKETQPAWPFGPILTLPVVLDGGDDLLSGGSGNDRLIVTFDSSFVEVDGGSDVDTLQMGFDDAAVADFIAAFPAALSTDPDNFTARIDLAAGTGSYRFNGTIIALDLTIEEVENVDGSAFSETISGDAGANVINGEGGNDTLQGRGGADTLNGGSGRDRAVYDNSVAIDIDLTRTTQLGGEAQGDRLISVEDIDGSRASDRIRGNAANNELFGNFGNDFLEGRGGADILDGGGGIDTASYESSFSGVFVRLDEGTGDNGDAEGDELISIENLTGSNFDDDLIGSGAANVLKGGTGHDVLEGLDGDDTLDGGFQNDTLDGGEGTDTATFAGASVFVQVILGQNGADGRASHGAAPERDTLRSIEDVIGSIFDDAIFGNEQANEFDGNQGNDYFTDSRGNDRYIGGAGLDTLDLSYEPTAVNVNLATGVMTHVGSTERDTLASIERVVGTAFDDTFTSSSQDDILIGNAGNDTYVINDAGDTVSEQANRGIDTVNSSVSVTLSANVENVTLTGISDIDATGNALDNLMRGNGGDNTLTGGGGRDTMSGGAGVDVFVFRSPQDSAPAAPDQILDFVSTRFSAVSDKIDLSQIDANIAAAGDQQFLFIGNNNAFSDNLGTGQLRVNGGFVEGDVDGDLVADFRIQVFQQDNLLIDADFIL